MKEIPQCRFFVSPGDLVVPYCALGNGGRCLACRDYEPKQKPQPQCKTRK